MDVDYLIAGAGCSGLSLAVALADALADGGTAGATGRRVLLVDPRTEFGRDRTWCYWHFDSHDESRDAGPFARCVSHRWGGWRVVGGGVDVTRSATGVEYRHVASDDFYAAALDRLSRNPTVEVRLGRSVVSLDDDGRGVTATLDDGSTVRAARAFDSRPTRADAPGTRPDDLRLHQQFVGHFVTTPRPAFDPSAVTLMDFRAAPGNPGDVRFAYVLPFAPDRALVEATTIAARRVVGDEHEAAIGDYLRRVVGVDRWEVTGTERGAIPMTTAPTPVVRSPNVWNVGVAGGMAKPSTGYAFAAIQRFSREAARRLVEADGAIVVPPAVRSGKAAGLDRVFLSRLARRPDLAAGLFGRLFDRADPASLARFLSDAGTVADDARVVAALPKLPFAAEAVRSWKRWLRPPPLPHLRPRPADPESSRPMATRPESSRPPPSHPNQTPPLPAPTGSLAGA